jgi:O-antigen/teichoic acid export membrane protein
MNTNSGESHKREIFSGAAVAFVLKSIAFLATFGLSLVVARVLDVADAGLVFLSIAIVTVLSTLSRIGIDKPLIRLVASLQESKDTCMIRAALTQAVVLVGILGIFCAAVVIARSEWISTAVFSKPELESLLATMAGAIPCIAIASTIAFAYQGQKALVRYLALFSIAVPGLALGFIAVAGGGISSQRVCQFYLIAAAITLVVGLCLWRASHGYKWRPVTALLPALAACRSTFVVVLSQMANTWAAVLLLGVLADSDSVALYHVANRTALLISFALIAVNSIAAPKFAGLYHSRSDAALAKSAQFSTRLMVVGGLPLFLVFLIFPNWVLSLFGSEFSGAANVLRVLAVGQFISISCGSVANLLLMTGHERDLRNVSIAATLLHLVASILAIPEFGAIGAAIATMVALAFLNLGSACMVRVRLGFWSIGLFPMPRTN